MAVKTSGWEEREEEREGETDRERERGRKRVRERERDSVRINWKICLDCLQDRVRCYNQEPYCQIS